jgi:hypothetical protein
MRKIAVLLTALSMTFASAGHAQYNNNRRGNASNAGSQTASQNGFAWGIGCYGWSYCS